MFENVSNLEEEEEEEKVIMEYEGNSLVSVLLEARLNHFCLIFWVSRTFTNTLLNEIRLLISFLSH